MSTRSQTKGKYNKGLGWILHFCTHSITAVFCDWLVHNLSPFPLLPLFLSQRRTNPPQASHTSSAPKTNLTCTQLEQMARERKGGRGEEGGSEKKAAGGRLCAV